MSKALKSIVVVNLLLSVGVIALGVLSFSSRQVLKAEAVELEKTVSKLSQDLQWGTEVAWEQPEEKKSNAFSFSQPSSPDGLSNLDTELDDLNRFATQRQAQLIQRSTELTSTKNTLADTQDVLATRKRELTAANNQEEQLKIELEKTSAQISEIVAKISELKSAKASKETQITTKNDTLTDLNNELASLEIDLETRVQERDNAQANYERCRMSAAGDQENDGGSARGKKGLVLAVNQDWQFVVMDKGDAEITVDTSAFVHRGKELVGKLQVVRVENELAIAKIITESVTPGDTIKPGDTLFF